MKRTYSPEEKANVLAVCAELGPYRASKAESAPSYATLCRWCKEAGIATLHREKTQAAIAARQINIAATRTFLQERLLLRAVDLEARMDEPHIDFKSAGPLGPMEVTFPKATAQACQQYATAIGILIDKFRLESGEVTGREEVVTVDAVDAAIRDLEAELARRGAVERGAPD